MLEKKERILYFLGGCITLRTIIAILPLYLPEEWLFYFGLVLFVIGISFLYLYFNNLRLQAPEGGGITWWANFRLLHGALYLVAAQYSLKKQRIGWIPLTMDVILGLLLFINKHKFINLQV